MLLILVLYPDIINMITNDVRVVARTMRGATVTRGGCMPANTTTYFPL
jgi:hypothetical protein